MPVRVAPNWEDDPAPDTGQLDADVAENLNWAYRNQCPGLLSFPTYRAVCKSEEFHNMTLAEFRTALKTGDAMKVYGIGPVGLKQLRLAFGVRGIR